jgi:anthranilate/para-aminobenzoate synthase component II
MGELDPGVEIRVHRNDQVTLRQLDADAPTAHHLTPACTPLEGVSAMMLSGTSRSRVPLLGVCWGISAWHTCMEHALSRRRIMHGRSSLIRHDGQGIFRGLPVRSRRPAITRSSSRRHAAAPVRGQCHVRDDPAEIMAIRHRSQPPTACSFTRELLTRRAYKPRQLPGNRVRVGT